MTAHGAALELAARRKALRQIFAPGWAVLACILVAAQAPAEIRAPVVIVFFCFVPGTALVGLLNLDSFGVELSLSVGLSVAVSGLTGGILVYAHLWSPTAVVLIVAAISLAAGLRDSRLRQRLNHVPPYLLRLLRALLAGGVAAASRGSRRTRGRDSQSVTGAPTNRPPASPARRRLRGIVAARPPGAPTHRRPRRERPVAQPIPTSPLQRFLLDELRRRTGADDSRRPPSSLAHVQPDELADLLSWSSLQRFITQRAIQEINPELWFVDDLDRRLRGQTRISRGELPSRVPLAAPRGVWIRGVSARASIPVAWRLREDDEKGKEWRTRLALEMMDALPELGLGGAVVVAGTAYGSLSGFRRGLEARDLPYLLRVDPITAARELAPHRPSRSAAEARHALRDPIADGSVVPAGAQLGGAHSAPELVLVAGPEHLLVCEVRDAGRAGAFWISNLPAETAPGRLASLIRLADRSRLKRTKPDLLDALEADTDGGVGLSRELALLALAGGLRTLDLPTAPTRGGVET